MAAAVGGLSFGVAPGAKLHAVRILDCEGSGAGGVGGGGGGGGAGLGYVVPKPTQEGLGRGWR